jgi:site-specific recombinase XerD
MADEKPQELTGSGRELVGISAGSLPATTTLSALAAVPEEQIWLGKLRSQRTREAYRRDVRHFMETLGIETLDELRRTDHRAVLAWEASMREREGLEASTIRRRLAALSSLFTHLVQYGAVATNPVRDIERPAVNRREGKTLAFSQQQARAILDAPPADTVQGLRDRAMLAVGFQVGLRRAEIAALCVGDLHQNRGYDSLWVTRKGRKRDSLAVHPQVVQRIRDYLATASHGADLDGPLFRPVRGNGEAADSRRHLAPDAIDRMLRQYARRIGLERGYSAHSMRATFITTALDNGASLEDVQRAAGHADPSTTRLYDRRGHNPEKSASFFASY